MPSNLTRVVARFTASETAKLEKSAGSLTLANYLRRLAGFEPLHRGATAGNKNAKSDKKKQDNA